MQLTRHTGTYNLVTDKLRHTRSDAYSVELVLNKHQKKERRGEIYLPRTVTVSNKKNTETILKLARSSLPEKQNAIYAGRQHC